MVQWIIGIPQLLIFILKLLIAKDYTQRITNFSFIYFTYLFIYLLCVYLWKRKTEGGRKMCVDSEKFIPFFHKDLRAGLKVWLQV